MRINQVDAYNFLILLPEKEDVKKKMDKDTAIDVKKKGMVLCSLSRIMFTLLVHEKILGQRK